MSHGNARLDVHVRPADVHTTLAKHMLADGFPLVFDLEKSSGARIVDARDGRSYLDFFGFFASAPLGANHPKMLEPAFLKKLTAATVNNPTNSDIYTVPMAEFVETFARFAAPPELPHLFFVAGGAPAVENGMKVAMDWKVRKNIARGKGEKGQKVLHFKEAFHGRLGYTLTTTNTSDPRKHMYFDKLDWPRVLNPKARFPLEGENLAATVAAEEEAVRQIEAAFDRDGDDICAILIEPIQGEGGDNHFRAEFFRELRRIADEREAMLIFDEVQTGFGGTGKLWCYEHIGVVPDIVAFGKKTQVCGIMVSPRVDEVEHNVFVESTRINSTWGGNLSDMVRATRYMQIMAEEDLVTHTAAVGEVLQAELNALRERHPDLVSNVRGRGTFCAFDLPTAEQRNTLLSRCYDAGLIIVGCGTSAVRFRPPLVLTAEEAREGVAIVERAVASLAG